MTKIPELTEKQRESHLGWLKELTEIPTAAGCESRVIAWIEAWLGHRRSLKLTRDKADNLVITPRGFNQAKRKKRPLYITAHLDHPAFIVHGVKDDIVELDFRGSVHDAYFVGSKIEILGGWGARHRAVIEELDANASPFKRVSARLARPQRAPIPGDIGRWALPASSIAGGRLHAPACDDLAAVAAALAVIDRTHRRKAFQHVGLLLTRAEEVGFLGAIAACKSGTVTKSSRLICLENSRSFAESAIGNGPILRVGDKISVFEPNLTNLLTAIMLNYGSQHPEFRWQRRLMPGGTCEATTFASYGFESTCICLPLGNYHNMKDVDAVVAGRKPAKIARECISIDDFHGLVQMLLICAAELDNAKHEPIRARMEKLFKERAKAVLVPMVS